MRVITSLNDTQQSFMYQLILAQQNEIATLKEKIVGHENTAIKN